MIKISFSLKILKRISNFLAEKPEVVMVTTKTVGLEKSQAISSIYSFFKSFENWLSQSTPLKMADLEKYLTHNFQITSNGQVVGRSAADYLIRVQRFQKKYSKFAISQPLEEPIISGNQIALNYKVDLTSRSGQSKQVFIMVLATIEDNKIARWTQVAHEKGTGDWDK